MYVCAALAKLPSNDTLYAWYYLRWGLGLYTNVPAMNQGGIERYNGKFLIAGISLLVYVVLAVAFLLVCKFRYKGGPKEADESYAEEDEDDDVGKVKFAGGEDDQSGISECMYNGKFLIAGISLLVYVVLAVAFLLVCKFRYKGGPKEADESYAEEDEDDVDVGKVKFAGGEDDQSGISECM
ncbi:hypothetical protein SprV_0200739000 [Sparganum proliferum]